MCRAHSISHNDSSVQRGRGRETLVCPSVSKDQAYLPDFLISIPENSCPESPHKEFAKPLKYRSDQALPSLFDRNSGDLGITYKLFLRELRAIYHLFLHALSFSLLIRGGSSAVSLAGTLSFGADTPRPKNSTIRLVH